MIVVVGSVRIIVVVVVGSSVRVIVGIAIGIVIEAATVAEGSSIKIIVVVVVLVVAIVVVVVLVVAAAISVRVIMPTKPSGNGSSILSPSCLEIRMVRSSHCSYRVVVRSSDSSCSYGVYRSLYLG